MDISRTAISAVFFIRIISGLIKTEWNIDLLIHITRIYSEDIGMSFGLDDREKEEKEGLSWTCDRGGSYRKHMD